MGTATCEGTPGLTKDLPEEMHLTAGLGTPGDPAVDGSRPAGGCPRCPATPNGASGWQMEARVNKPPRGAR